MLLSCMILNISETSEIFILENVQHMSCTVNELTRHDLFCLMTHESMGIKETDFDALWSNLHHDSTICHIESVDHFSILTDANLDAK